MLARSSVVAIIGTHVVVAAALPMGFGEVVSFDRTREPSAVSVLSSAEPFRLEVSAAGSVQRITIRGTGFENEAHEDRDQYMHWQIRRDDGSWQPCATWNSTPTATCKSDGWSSNSQTLQIGGDYVRRAGFVELRVFQGLADVRETDPRNAPTATEWSNVLRVPVVVPGAAPTIISLSNNVFPLKGDAAAYQFSINASGIDESAVVVFRGDVVVAPERIDGSRIQVSVPAVYRVTTPTEMTLTVRTNRGGPSPVSYIRFVDQEVKILQGARIGTPAQQIPIDRAGAVVPNAGRTTVGKGVSVARPTGAACNSGFVWRGATAQDFACVTPDTRTLTAQQNAAAASRRANDSGACVSGYVWREAVPGDIVCVTPAERTQAAEDNRLASSRTAPVSR
jgi:hypothetical protein